MGDILGMTQQQDKIADLKKRVRDIQGRIKSDKEYRTYASDRLTGLDPMGSWTPEELKAQIERYDGEIAKRQEQLDGWQKIIAKLEASRPAEAELPFVELLGFYQGLNRENARNGLELMKVAMDEGSFLPGFSRRVTACLNPAKISKKANKAAFEKAFAPVKAKMDELAAVIRQEPDAKFRKGTCQCCFNVQKVSKGDGKRIALHGYERPGVGYILGRCRGEDEVPYEVSCEKTKVFRAEVVDARKAKLKTLAEVKANKAELGVQINTAEKTSSTRSYRGWVYKQEYVVVKLGDESKPNPHHPDSYNDRIPSYEDVKRSTIRTLEQIIGQMEGDIAFLTGKIDSWKQVWAE